MALREERNKTREAIIEGRFITHVLTNEGQAMNTDIGKRVAGFSSALWDNRNFKVDDNRLTYTHLKQHRFLDMKNRTSKRGKRRKIQHAVHNKPLYGHANEIIKELTVGLTDAVREQMAQLGPLDD